jgi:uncharacterized protein
VAEDGQWAERAKPVSLYLTSSGQLLLQPPDQAATLQSQPRIVVATTMFENGSWGQKDNEDLPGDQRETDQQALTFDSLPLPSDLDVFGFPSVDMTLASDKPRACLAVRLCEVSPETGASRLVSYAFFNLCCRSGDMARPELLESGQVFSVRIPLNVIGHTFRKGWVLRLSISSSLFPVLWTTPELPSLTVHVGPWEAFPIANLSLPCRVPRKEDTRMASLFPDDAAITHPDASLYVPTVTTREGGHSRSLQTTTVAGATVTRVEKTTDTGQVLYQGPLQSLLVEQVTREDFTIRHDDPLSHRGSTSMVTTMERGSGAAAWKVCCTTSTELWSSLSPTGEPAFHYLARLQTQIADAKGDLQPFVNRTLQGSIPRLWS